MNIQQVLPDPVDFARTNIAAGFTQVTAYTGAIIGIALVIWFVKSLRN